MVMVSREEHPLKASLPISVTPCAIITSVSSRSFKKLSTPEYTADLGIFGKDLGKDLGRMKLKLLTALELGYGVNV